MCLPKINIAVTIPYTLVSSLVGNSRVTVQKKSYSSLVVQVKATKRTFYSYTTKKKIAKRNVYSDEKGIADVYYEWHPVGTGYKKSTYCKQLIKGKKIQTGNYSNKSLILKRCAVNYAHRGMESYSIDYKLVGSLTTKWKKKK